MTYLRKRFYDTCFLDLFSESSQNNRSASLTLGIYKIQWKQLNGITLGQRQSNTKNLLIIINKLASTIFISKSSEVNGGMIT
jgi:hypothetical protein